MAIWDVINDIRNQGTTVILTTHFMEEAEKLCDRIRIIDGGKLVALDTVSALIAGLDAPVSMSFRVSGQVPVEDIRRLPAVQDAEVVDDRVSVRDQGISFSRRCCSSCRTGLWAHEIRTEQASLEAVFLELTGEQPEVAVSA